MKISFELETENPRDIRSAYEAILPLAQKVYSTRIMKILVPKTKSDELDSDPKKEGEE